MSDWRCYVTADMHDRLAPLDYLEGCEEPFFALDIGDAIGGSNTLFSLHEQALQRMARLPFVAQAMGNRELHYLRSVRELRAWERDFPLLAANLIDLRRPQGPSEWQAYHSFNINGCKVACLGLTVVQYPEKSLWERIMGLRFLEPERVLPELTSKLRATHDVIIACSHLGKKRDLELEPYFQDVDFVLGGHSHDLFDGLSFLGSTPWLHIGSHGRVLACLDYSAESAEPWKVELIAL